MKNSKHRHRSESKEEQPSTRNTRRHSNHRLSVKKRKKRKRLILGAILALVAIVAVAVYMFTKTLTDFTDNIYEEVNSEKLRDASAQLTSEKPITILLSGLDNGALFYKDVKTARTDVLMVITINPKDHTSSILSIPRDTLAAIGTTNDFDKINQAYVDGGIETTINTVQRFLDIPIDFYVTVNMKGFIDVIDAMGGVKITSTMTFTQDGSSFTEGETRTLNGEDAINYVRMREEDPQGDVGRGKRQQQLVQAVVDQALSWGSITNYKNIIEQLGDSIKTNLTLSDMVVLQTKYLDALKNPEHLIFQNYQDLNLYFGYYMLITEKERIEMSNKIRAQLGLGDTDSRIVYPVSFGVTSNYFNVYDANGDGVITDSDMAILPGVYTKDKLDRLIQQSGLISNDATTSSSTSAPSDYGTSRGNNSGARYNTNDRTSANTYSNSTTQQWATSSSQY